MGNRAVYSNKGLGVYITREHFEELINVGAEVCSLYVGKEKVQGLTVRVILDPEANALLRRVFYLETKAISDARYHHTADKGGEE